MNDDPIEIAELHILARISADDIYSTVVEVMRKHGITSLDLYDELADEIAVTIETKCRILVMSRAMDDE